MDDSGQIERRREGRSAGIGNALVLSPRQPLVAGAGAEDFESSVKRLLGQGHRLLIADLNAVNTMDSAGIRALVRAHSSANRVGGSFRIARPTERTRELLKLARLDGVLSIHDSIAEAKHQPIDWSEWGRLFVGILACLLIAFIGLLWRTPEVGKHASGLTASDGVAPILWSTPWGYPFTELVQLMSASVIAIFVTHVQKRHQSDRPMNRSMEQAQVLLAVSGSLIMIIIGSSLARAFGIAGAAGIIRFRTPVEDPKDVTVLFLLMGLGMACGIGALPVAALGALFLAAAIVVLDKLVAVKPRIMLVEVTATGREFPLAHVVSVFANYGITWEPLEFAQDDEAEMTYRTTLPPHVLIDEVTEALVGDGKLGLSSVSWEKPKKS
ncbi:MAG: STAS domain-containing protein [Vicinamibacterales bacterium]